MSYGMGDYYNIPLYKSNKYNIENIIKEPQPESEFFKKKHHSPKKQVRKCSYVIAVIKTDKFIQLGAKEIHNGIYIINKKYTEVSFMIFRTGSCLIVGNCSESILMFIFDFIKNILKQEYEKISVVSEEPIVKTKKSKLRKKNVTISNNYYASDVNV
jgi:hypothetical protein